MTIGPFRDAFEADTKGVIRREITTYRVDNGIMIKGTTVRDYYSDGDYHDSMSSLPLVER